MKDLASGFATALPGPDGPEPVPVSAIRRVSTDARLLTNSESYTDGLRDLAAMPHVPDYLRGILRDSAELIDKAETENGSLRIAFWNFGSQDYRVETLPPHGVAKSLAQGCQRHAVSPWQRLVNRPAALAFPAAALVMDDRRLTLARRVDEHYALGAVQRAGCAAVGADRIGADRLEGVLAVAGDVTKGLHAGQVQAVGNKALKAHLAAFSRRSSSASTASRMKSDCFSRSVKTALIRSSVPSRNRAIVCSPLIRGLPTGAGVSDTTNCVESCILMIPPIDCVSGITYLGGINYGGNSMTLNRYADLMQQGFMKPANARRHKARTQDEAAWAKRCAEATRAHYARVGFD